MLLQDRWRCRRTRRWSPQTTTSKASHPAPSRSNFSPPSSTTSCGKIVAREFSCIATPDRPGVGLDPPFQARSPCRRPMGDQEVTHKSFDLVFCKNYVLEDRPQNSGSEPYDCRRQMNDQRLASYSVPDRFHQFCVRVTLRAHRVHGVAVRSLSAIDR